MFKKFLIVASKLDTAGINITTQLSQYPGYKFYLVEDEIIYDENLDKEKINEFDFVVFASKHRSEKGEKSLSVHSTGNWREAKFGGKEGKLSKSSSQFNKQLFSNLVKNAKESSLDNHYSITLECTHHGPLLDIPSVFIEIGSTENEWKDNRAGFVIAKTIHETIQNFKVNKYNENAIAIGGPHYCPTFNKMQAGSNVAISHIIPQYVMPITEQNIREAISKTSEEIDFAVIDWKGLGRAEQRNEVLKILDKLYIRYKKTSDINRETDYKS